MKRARRAAVVAFVLVCGAFAVACTLNPQPLPPGSMSSADDDAGTRSDANGTPGSPDAGIDANGYDAGNADAASDATRDNTDGGDGGDGGGDGGADATDDGDDGATDAQGD